jgi:flagellar hook-basal body complex protein FliE
MIAAIPLISSALSMLGSSGTSSATQSATGAASGTAATGGTSFGDMMTKLSKDAVGNVQHAESMSVDGLSGKADVQGVVQAVMTAQESLQTALAIRDKAVAAFQEVSRMSI